MKNPGEINPVTPGIIRGKIEVTAIYFVLILFALAYVVPFLWLLSGSLKTSSELFRIPPTWIPEEPKVENFVNALTAFPFFLYLRNTMIIVVFNIIGTVLSSSFVAYGFQVGL